MTGHGPSDPFGRSQRFLATSAWRPSLRSEGGCGAGPTQKKRYAMHKQRIQQLAEPGPRRSASARLDVGCASASRGAARRCISVAVRAKLTIRQFVIPLRFAPRRLSGEGASRGWQQPTPSKRRLNRRACLRVRTPIAHQHVMRTGLSRVTTLVRPAPPRSQLAEHA